MTARDTIAGAILGARAARIDWSDFDLADAVIAAVRAMSHDELTELRPDIATEYHAHLDTAATRGQYLLNRLRAHTTTQEAS